jgi:hypothetical protein
MQICRRIDAQIIRDETWLNITNKTVFDRIVRPEPALRASQYSLGTPLVVPSRRKTRLDYLQSEQVKRWCFFRVTFTEGLKMGLK